MGLSGELANGFGEADVIHFHQRYDFVSRGGGGKGGSDQTAGRRQAEER